jgi:hypothetical protein
MKVEKRGERVVKRTRERSVAASRKHTTCRLAHTTYPGMIMHSDGGTHQLHLPLGPDYCALAHRRALHLRRCRSHVFEAGLCISFCPWTGLSSVQGRSATEQRGVRLRLPVARDHGRPSVLAPHAINRAPGSGRTRSRCHAGRERCRSARASCLPLVLARASRPRFGN